MTEQEELTIEHQSKVRDLGALERVTYEFAWKTENRETNVLREGSKDMPTPADWRA